MNDYDFRRFPIDKFCPRCLAFGRKQYCMAQRWGSGEFRLTCSDYSVCPWSEVSKLPWVIGGSDGQDIDKRKV